ncbi:hypothetical protein D3C80_1844070 [compost metagenome]
MALEIFGHSGEGPRGWAYFNCSTKVFSASSFSALPVGGTGISERAGNWPKFLNMSLSFEAKNSIALKASSGCFVLEKIAQL